MFNKHDNLHFANEKDIHISSENNEESGYDLLTISYYQCMIHKKTHQAHQDHHGQCSR